MNRGIAVLQTAALPLGYVAGIHSSQRMRVHSVGLKNGAEDGIRTRDPRLGKAMLYH